MADDNSHNSENNPKDIKPVNPVIADKQTDSVIKEKESQTNPTEDNKTKSDSSDPLLVKIQENKKWKRAEIISVFAIVISACLFIMTLIAFNKTSEAVKISEKGLNNTIFKDSILNQPYLQVDGVTLTEINMKKDLGIKYVLKNYGQLPAMMLTEFTNIGYSYNWHIDSITKNPLTLFKTDTLWRSIRIISKESPDTLLIDVPHLEPPQIIALTNGMLICYLYGRYIYSSPIYTSKHEYKFVIRLNFYGDNTIANGWRTKYTFLYNERTVIK